ncbi:hypothetical protein STAS_28428 [Striga asiatica]|uniref:Uncharacterized protein n=1 Tax=Striga asiatica TaxID=4170 RepID=A0A5A7R079_STRAF|nr:hypothetical protein STAS_28428 [Striga asiatica]
MLFATGKSLEDLLLSIILLNLSESGSDTDSDGDLSKTQLARKEFRLEKEIVLTILSSEIEKLKLNFCQAVTIDEHHICEGFQEEISSDYPDKKKRSVDDDDEKAEEAEKVMIGELKELIESVESGSGRILHRTMNVKSGPFIQYFDLFA